MKNLGIFGIGPKPKAAQKENIEQAVKFFNYGTGPDSPKPKESAFNPDFWLSAGQVKAKEYPPVDPAFFSFESAKKATRELDDFQQGRIGSDIEYIRSEIDYANSYNGKPDTSKLIRAVDSALGVFREANIAGMSIFGTSEPSDITALEQLRSAIENDDNSLRDKLLNQLKRRYPKAEKTAKSASDDVFEAAQKALDSNLETIKALQRKWQNLSLSTLGQKIGGMQMNCESGNSAACQEADEMRREYNARSGGQLLNFWNGG